jgi:hypothetical protein
VTALPRAHQGDDVRIASQRVLLPTDRSYDISATKPNTANGGAL